MNLERASLLAISLGLACVGQPWVHFLFTAGFPLILAGILAYNASAWMGPGDGP